jgi:hypothetical protein
MKYFTLIYFLIIGIEFSHQEEHKLNAIHCNNKGIYIKPKNECKCIEGYDTFPVTSNIKCNYEIKLRSIALFCSIFGGIIGADMIYLGHSMKAIFKSFFPTFVIIFIFRIQNNKTFLKIKLSYYLSIIPIFIWLLLWAVDIIYILYGNVKDSNGINLL